MVKSTEIINKVADNLVKAWNTNDFNLMKSITSVDLVRNANGEDASTGKSGKTVGFTVLTFDDTGKIVHEQAYYDLLCTVNTWGYSATPPNSGSNK